MILEVMEFLLYLTAIILCVVCLWVVSAVNWLAIRDSYNELKTKNYENQDKVQHRRQGRH